MIENVDSSFWKIIMMRGLGHSIKETAEDLGMSTEQVRYRMRYIKQLVRDNGDDRVFFQAAKAFLSVKDLKDKLGNGDTFLY